MTSNEIKAYIPGPTQDETPFDAVGMLKEIAYQLAIMNERNAKEDERLAKKMFS